MIPSTGAETVVSIFMASMVTSLSPALTSVPGETAISVTMPGSGAQTWEGSLGSPLRRAAVAVLVRDLSVTMDSRGMPLSS